MITAKNWTRPIIIALALMLVGSIILLRPWSRLRDTPPPASRPKGDIPGAQAPGSLPEPTLEALIHNMEDPDWTVRWDAVNTLGKRKDRRAIPALVRRAVSDDNPHPRWRSLWALKAVDATGGAALPALRTALQDPDPVVARNAAIGLAFFGQPEARAELLEGLKDKDSFRRWEAVYSLRRIGNPEVAEALLPLLEEEREPEETVRSQVALTLGSMGGQETLVRLLETLKEDQSPRVRQRAAMTLARIGTAGLSKALEQILTTEQEPQVREYIRVALTKIQNRWHISK